MIMFFEVFRDCFFDLNFFHNLKNFLLNIVYNGYKSMLYYNINLLLVDKNGNMSYLEGQNIIDNIGKSIGISGPSDDVPRLRLIA